jgi:hypothetical protein
MLGDIHLRWKNWSWATDRLYCFVWDRPTRTLFPFTSVNCRWLKFSLCDHFENCSFTRLEFYGSLQDAARIGGLHFCFAPRFMSFEFSSNWFALAVCIPGFSKSDLYESCLQVQRQPTACPSISIACSVLSHMQCNFHFSCVDDRNRLSRLTLERPKICLGISLWQIAAQLSLDPLVAFA